MKNGAFKQVAFLLVIFGVSSVWADTGPWAFVRPDGTQHWYKVVHVPGGINWVTARNNALADGGYLATLTSVEENDFVFGLCDDPAYWNPRIAAGGSLVGPWLGGKQATGAPEPAGQWEWITGEPFAYTNWAPGQPDDHIPNENSLYFGEMIGTRLNAWSDTRALDTNVQAYVIEYNVSPRTAGLLLLESNVTPGYILFAPLSSTNTYLIDNAGMCVHQWPSSYLPGNSVYMIPTGTIMRTATDNNTTFTSGGQGGRIEEIDWNGNLLWAFDYSSTNVRQHHDIEILPHGNILMLAWEFRSYTQAVSAGRDPLTLSDGKLWPDHVIEVAPTGSYGGDIVWEWHLWDHLIQDFDAGKANYGVVSNHPERVNINYFQGSNADWNHCNGIDYNPGLDQIAISVRNFSEIWIIDHSTTPAEARGSTGGRYGMGGDLLYRWGNPAAYDSGTSFDQRLFVQHNVQWIETNCPGAGHFLVFNNGDGRPGGNSSSIDEWTTPIAVSGSYTQQPDGSWGPTGACWTYEATPRLSFYSSHISGAQRQTNGNTIICDGNGGRFFDVTYAGQEVWSYESPVSGSMMVTQGAPVTGNSVFRSERYDAQKYLAGLILEPGHSLEIYPAKTDYDGDEMEDAWECRYALNPALATDALLDPDEDHFISIEEYIADTDPTNSLSFFSIETMSNTSHCTLYFQSSSNRTYSLEYSEHLATGVWMGVTGQTNQAGAGGLDHLMDTNDAQYGLYRIQVILPK